MSNYPITERIREKYPKESARWEELLLKAEDPKYRGCFTCAFYSEIHEDNFADVESVDENDSECEEWLPWTTGEAWVYCSFAREEETPLQINCSKWKLLEQRVG